MVVVWEVKDGYSGLRSSRHSIKEREHTYSSRTKLDSRNSRRESQNNLVEEGAQNSDFPCLIWHVNIMFTSKYEIGRWTGSQRPNAERIACWGSGEARAISCRMRP